MVCHGFEGALGVPVLYEARVIWSNLDESRLNLDESGLAGARTPKETYSPRNGGSEVPRFRGSEGFHRFLCSEGSSSGSDGSGYEGSVSFEGSVVKLFRCSVGSVLQLFRYFHYVRTRRGSRGVGGFATYVFVICRLFSNI